MLSAFGGCVATTYTDQVRAIDLGGAAGSSRTVSVLGQADVWRNSGVVVRAGATYQITATGQWRASGLEKWAGPDGTVPPGWGLQPPLVSGWEYMALIGKIGENGVPFGVGSNYTLVPAQDGTLYFRCNQPVGTCWNNQGQVTVTTRLQSQRPGEASAPSRESRPVHRSRAESAPARATWR